MIHITNKVLRQMQGLMQKKVYTFIWSFWSNTNLNHKLANWRAGPLYIQRQKYRCCFPGNIGIFLVGEVPNPLKDPYLAIRGCAFVPNALRCVFHRKYGMMIIPEGFEPPVRILRATIPVIGSQSRFRILLSIDYLLIHYL